VINLEDQLRDAMKATTSGVHAPPGLASAARSGARLTRRHRRLALVAAAAVVAVAVPTGVMLSHDGKTQVVSAAPAGSPGLAALPPVDTARAGRFYATVGGYVTAGPTKLVDAPAVIHDATTGRTVASVALPSSVGFWSAAAGTAVPGLFYLAATPAKHDGGLIYRLRVSDSGTVTELARVTTIPEVTFIYRILAASPDGTQLAFKADEGRPLETRTERPPTVVKVVDVRTGARKRFAAAGNLDIDGGLSWDATGRYLGLGLTDIDTQVGYLYVLDTATPGGLLDRSSRVPGSPAASASQPLTGVTLSPDRRSFYFTRSGQDVDIIYVTDVATGNTRPLISVPVPRPANMYADVLRINRTGSQLLLMEAAPDFYRVDIAGLSATHLSYSGESTGNGPLDMAW